MARAHRKARKHAKRNPQGILSVRRGGFGFVTAPEGEYFIPSANIRGAFDGDLVEIVPLAVNRQHAQPGKAHHTVGQKPSARIVQVLERAHETLIGRYEIAEPFGIVVPLDRRIPHDIFTMCADNPDVHDGDIVKVRITQYPSPRAAATGKVEAVISRAGASDAPIMAIIAEHNLETEFPAAACAEAQAATVEVAPALAAGYRDLRDRCVFTIDPIDARDFDDALSLEPVGGAGAGWRLGVHIADVSHYVQPETALDRTARRRGTSVYLVDRVLPMLPEHLSNGVCSLRPDEDRLALTVDIFLDDLGDVQGFDCYQSVIRSRARLDYEQVDAFLGDASAHDEAKERATAIPQALHSALAALDRLAQMLAKQRRRAGALDLDSVEAHMVLDEAGAPRAVALRRTTRATSLVEQAMILANACVATRLNHAAWPCLYRVHETPAPEALGALVPILQEYGLDVGIDLALFQAGEPKMLQAVLERAHQEGTGPLISMLLLRSLKRACYEPACAPHYGLALDRYAHFTSPIRRYPDLIVHRSLTALINKDTATARALEPHLQQMADDSSAAERRADAAARESQEYKLIEYLQGFTGDIFPGMIVRIASYGFFVELENTAVGLVALGDAGDDIFALDVKRQTLIGRESGVVFRLGQRVSVRLIDARPAERQLDFSLVSSMEKGSDR